VGYCCLLLQLCRQTWLLLTRGLGRGHWTGCFDGIGAIVDWHVGWIVGIELLQNRRYFFVILLKRGVGKAQSGRSIQGLLVVTGRLALSIRGLGLGDGLLQGQALSHADVYIKDWCAVALGGALASELQFQWHTGQQSP